MAQQSANWRNRVNLTTLAALTALGLSLVNLFVSFHVSTRLDVNVTEVQLIEDGPLYVTVSFNNSGNRDAAVLRAEPALWSQRGNRDRVWVSLTEKVNPDVPLTEPKTPMMIRSGTVEVVTMSTLLHRTDTERALVPSLSGVFVGIRLATMDSDGSLHLLEHPVAKLVIDRDGKIRGVEPTIHRTLSGFFDLQVAPPGDLLQTNKRTPFVWVDTNR